jgi:adenosylcobinamide-GDP ribazoletransferase
MSKPNSDQSPVYLDVGVAFALLTRLPLPVLPDGAFAHQARAGWAFGLVGVVIGGLAGLAGWLALSAGLPVGIAAGLVLGVQIALSGAMHEDGLADTADGLWGGLTPARRLEIMKDSAIGTYGVLALILSLGLRWGALAALLAGGFAPVVAAGAVSRGLIPAVMAALPAARDDGLSHRVGRPGGGVATVAVGLGVVVALLTTGFATLVPIALAAASVAVVAAIARARIGGQTGDILGACQQVAEITMLLGFAAML